MCADVSSAIEAALSATRTSSPLQSRRDASNVKCTDGDSDDLPDIDELLADLYAPLRKRQAALQQHEAASGIIRPPLDSYPTASEESKYTAGKKRCKAITRYYADTDTGLATRFMLTSAVPLKQWQRDVAKTLQRLQKTRTVMIKAGRKEQKASLTTVLFSGLITSWEGWRCITFITELIRTILYLQLSPVDSSQDSMDSDSEYDGVSAISEHMYALTPAFLKLSDKARAEVDAFTSGDGQQEALMLVQALEAYRFLRDECSIAKANSASRGAEDWQLSAADIHRLAAVLSINIITITDTGLLRGGKDLTANDSAKWTLPIIVHITDGKWVVMGIPLDMLPEYSKASKLPSHGWDDLDSEDEDSIVGYKAFVEKMNKALAERLVAARYATIKESWSYAKLFDEESEHVYDAHRSATDAVAGQLAVDLGYLTPSGMLLANDMMQRDHDRVVKECGGYPLAILEQWVNDFDAEHRLLSVNRANDLQQGVTYLKQMLRQSNARHKEWKGALA